MDSGAVIYIPNVIKMGAGIRNWIGGIYIQI
jgi:hypothetical protein